MQFHLDFPCLWHKHLLSTKTIIPHFQKPYHRCLVIRGELRVDDTVNQCLLKLFFHSSKMAHSPSPRWATAATVGLTHGHWYVRPVQGAFLCADPLLVEHHGEVILTHGHFPICQRGHQGLQLFSCWEELFDRPLSIHLREIES